MTIVEHDSKRWLVAPYGDVTDEDAARMWAGKIAEACGWPQDVRRFKPGPRAQ